MPDPAQIPSQAIAYQLIGAGLLAAVGFLFLLPRPRHRQLLVGTFLGVSALGLLVAFLVTRFGSATADWVSTILFWFFAAGAVGFGTVLVVQRNPARGAIAFAFVVLSTCGLFLILAAPFLMATTIIVYAGAIIVTFLFVLMLSHVSGPADENDRSREPLLGGLAGFGFAGLVLFALHQSLPPASANTTVATPGLPLAPLTVVERSALLDAATHLAEAESANREQLLSTEFSQSTRERLESVVGGMTAPRGTVSLQQRLTLAQAEPRTATEIQQAAALKKQIQTTFDTVETALIDANPPDEARAKQALRELREQVVILAGTGGLPARNVSTLGLAIYSEHLLGVEMAGMLLLVATIGAVAIAHRRGDAT
ncbi:MAG: NADH-quinone oxidoreductase subunit J [Bacteroidales bacterium]|nr:NADH-quinone oxidoreductase subunit J [Bacteroidales bacterium]